MPIFELQSPDGKTFQVDAPDMQSASNSLKTHVGQWESANILPIARNTATGERALAVPGAISGMMSAATLPHDVYEGTEDPDSPKGARRAFSLSTLATPGSTALTAGERMVPGEALATKAAQSPSEKSLFTAGSKDFKDFRKTGITFNPTAVRDLGVGLESDLVKDGFRQTDAPTTFSKIREIANPPEGGTFDAAGYHSFRKSLNRTARNFNNPEDKAAAIDSIRRLDRWFDRLPKEGFVAGTSQEAVDTSRALMARGRGNWAAGERSNTLTSRLESTERRTSATNSGKNLDNKIRQKLATILDSKRLTRGYSPEELKGMDDIVRGKTPGVNAARMTSNILGGGGGMAAAIAPIVGAGTAYATGHLEPAFLGSAVPAAGMALKGTENWLTQNAADKLAETVRKRSPLYRQNPTALSDQAAKANLAKALLARQPQPTLTPDQIQAYQAGNLS